MFNDNKLMRQIVDEVLNIIYPFAKINIDLDNDFESIELKNTEDDAKKIKHIMNSYPKILRFLRNNFGAVTADTSSESDDKVKITATYIKPKSKYNDLLIQSLFENKFGNIPEDHFYPEVDFGVKSTYDKSVVVEVYISLIFYRETRDMEPNMVTIFGIVFSVKKEETEKLSFDLKITEQNIARALLYPASDALLDIYAELEANLFAHRKFNKSKKILEIYANKVLGINADQLAKEKVLIMNTGEYLIKFFNFVKELSETEKFQHLKPLVIFTEILGIEFFGLAHEKVELWKKWLSLV